MHFYISSISASPKRGVWGDLGTATIIHNIHIPSLLGCSSWDGEHGVSLQFLGFIKVKDSGLGISGEA